MLEEILAETGVQADHAIMVGDTSYDLENGEKYCHAKCWRKVMAYMRLNFRHNLIQSVSWMMWLLCIAHCWLKSNGNKKDLIQYLGCSARKVFPRFKLAGECCRFKRWFLSFKL